jgi:transglutaminase-like putative cysteine protease
MSWNRYFKLSSYGLIASGFVAIAATGKVDPFSLVLFGSALAVSWFIDTAALKQRLPPWVLNALVLAYAPCYLVDYRFLSRSFVVSTIHLIFYLAAVKILTRFSDGDYVYLYCVSFAELLAASILTVDITFLISLLVFLISSVSTLMLFEMRRTQTRVLKEGKIQPFVTPGPNNGKDMELFASFPAGSMALTTLAITLLIILLAIPLFLLLPRIALGIYSRPPGKSRMTSGFSERVELGEIGTIKESDAVVMKVRLTDPPAGLPGNLKWRGIALERYDGRSWSRSRLARTRVAPEMEYFKLERSIQGTQLLPQTFFLEALSTDVVFASNKVLAISTDLGFLQRDSSGNLFTIRHDARKIRYRAVSDITAPDPDLIPVHQAPLPESIQGACLQVPPLDKRISALARDVTAQIEHPYRKALALENYLRTSYPYSLTLKGPPNSSDPLAMFLFDIRSGHCEYFATAMTIMLRQLSIPARLVNGFRAGEYNRLAGAFVVRQYDAHSWVEAWFAPYGWVEFDPTPADPARSRSEIARLFNAFVDAASLWWWEEVVNYDVWKQFRVIASARAAIIGFQRGLKTRVLAVYSQLRAASDRSRLRSFAPGHMVIAVLAAALLAAVILVRYGHRSPWLARLRRALFGYAFPGAQDRIITICYREALALLESHGLNRAPSLTPLEFSLGLQQHPSGGPFGELTGLYNRVRFGSAGTDRDLIEAEGLLKKLRSILRTNRKS